MAIDPTMDPAMQPDLLALMGDEPPLTDTGLGIDAPIPTADDEALLAIADADPGLLTEDEAGQIGEWLPEDSAIPPTEFGANLAEVLDEGWLDRLAQRVIDWVDEDRQAREPWQQREARAMRMMGVTDDTDGGGAFLGASQATHPMLALGALQFQARAIAELWPAGGPAKSIVLGQTDEAREAQAKRVGAFLNYQYTNLMPGAFREKDRLLMRLPVSGSCFMRVYYDPVEETVVTRMAEASKVYVPYHATDLQTVPRFTYEFEETTYDTEDKQRTGFYRDLDLGQPTDLEDDNAVTLAIDAADGATHVSTLDDEDASATRYECACFLKLPDEDDDRAKPYLVTVDKDAVKVLRIQRNWRPSDPKCKRRVHLIHYVFTPGFGFYGFGLTHWTAGLQAAATGAMRAVLDSAFLANHQGGFVTRDARMGKGKLKVEMGQWNEVDIDANTLKTAFFPFPTKEPSPTLTKMLEVIGDLGNSLQATTENVVGESNNNAPVGTTLALIEQGLKIFSAVHKRLHEAQTEELKLVAELNAEYLPPEYPYAVEGEDQGVFAADFDERIDVLPVSDPNIVTNTQRIAQAQTVRQMAMEAPQLYDRRAVERWMMEVLRVPDIDAKLPPSEEIPRRDPVTENTLAMTGGAIKAYPDQDHQAHLAVHAQVLANLPPELQPGLQAHLYEHNALAYRVQMTQLLGGPLPDPNQQIDPQTDAMIAQQAAQATQLMLPDPAMNDPKAMLEQRKAEADIARKDALAQADLKRKQQQADFQMQQADIKAREQALIADAELKRQQMMQARKGGGIGLAGL